MRVWVEAAVLGCADDPVEGSACLERARVLEVLELEPARAAKCCIDSQQRSTAHASGDSSSGSLDVGAGDHRWAALLPVNVLNLSTS
jgi:hypothetical protein